MGDDPVQAHRTARTPRGGVRGGDFDAGALFAALDHRRRQQALSWRQVADAIWAQSSELNDRRHDHPIAVATLTGIRKRNNISCQHALFVLRWLGQGPEEFIADPAPGTTGSGLPEAGPDRRPRWDLGALHQATDARRREQDLTWKELAERLGCTPSQLTGIRTARFAIGMRLAMRITQWIGRPASEFIHAAPW